MPPSSPATGDFTGKVVIVTGSTGGIGRGIALEFGRQGASLTIHGQSADKADETRALLAKEGVPPERVLIVLGPIQDAGAAERLINETVEKFGRLDVLVNNAGVVALHGETALSQANFDYIFAVNVRSMAQLTELAVPHLEKSSGNVVNIGSSLSKSPAPSMMFYSMSKAAVDHFTRNAANLYGPKGIRVNSVNPGPILTDNFTKLPAAQLTKIEEKFASPSGGLIIRRFGQVEEIAPAVAFVANSKKASYMTGAVLFLDGGNTSFGN